MPASLEAKARTRAFARVIGPSLVLVPGILVVRAPDIRTILLAFFQNEALVLGVGVMLLIGGLLIIAYHQYWSSPAAVMISLLGWLLALRGLMLLAAPRLIACWATALLDYLPAVRIGFSLFVLVGLWLTYAGWFAKPPENGS
jgi:hypothetical protein